MRLDIALLTLLALVVAGALFGHFVKPHGDFYEFAEAGEALLRGHLPATMKRAPVYPLLIATGGRLVSASGLSNARPAILVAAETLNGVLLAVNALLLYGVVRRLWPGGATWAGAWLVLLPIGLYCTAHALVEPLLITLILATALSLPRHVGVAYGLAALAAITRYDLAGLILGVMLADVFRSGNWRRALLRGTLAGLPLLLWLGLTAATWRTRSEDHYLRQIAERPSANLAWLLDLGRTALLPADRLQVPVLLSELPVSWLALTHGALSAFALLGVVASIRRRSTPLVALGVFVLSYLAVHAVFPFQLERFGYPAAAAGLVFVFVGADEARRGAVALQWRARFVRRGIRMLLLLMSLVVALAAVALLSAELAASPRFATPRLAVLLPAALGFVALATAGGLMLMRRARTPRRVIMGITLGLVATWLAVVELRAASPRLGRGDEMRSVVAAARWIPANLPGESRVASIVPGLLRLYAPESDPARFVHLKDVPGEDLSAALAACRAAGVRYLLWYEGAFSEQGAYYIAAWRLRRFEALDATPLPSGVELVEHFGDQPPTRLLRILDAPPGQAASTTRLALPSAASSSAGETTGTAPASGG